MANSEKYCGGDTLGDVWAKKISELYTNLVRDLNVQHPLDHIYFQSISGHPFYIVTTD